VASSTLAAPTLASSTSSPPPFSSDEGRGPARPWRLVRRFNFKAPSSSASSESPWSLGL
jgi:hypothetical protein